MGRQTDPGALDITIRLHFGLFLLFGMAFFVARQHSGGWAANITSISAHIYKDSEQAQLAPPADLTTRQHTTFHHHNDNGNHYFFFLQQAFTTNALQSPQRHMKELTACLYDGGKDNHVPHRCCGQTTHTEDQSFTLICPLQIHMLRHVPGNHYHESHAMDKPSAATPSSCSMKPFCWCGLDK